MNAHNVTYVQSYKNICVCNFDTIFCIYIRTEMIFTLLQYIRVYIYKYICLTAENTKCQGLKLHPERYCCCIRLLFSVEYALGSRAELVNVKVILSSKFKFVVFLILKS